MEPLRKLPASVRTSLVRAAHGLSLFQIADRHRTAVNPSHRDRGRNMVSLVVNPIYHRLTCCPSRHASDNGAESGFMQTEKPGSVRRTNGDGKHLAVNGDRIREWLP